MLKRSGIVKVNTTGGKIDQYLLSLNAHPKIGSQTLKKILAFFDTPKRIWESKEGTLLAFDEKIGRLVIEAREQYDPKKIIEDLGRADVGYMTIYDKSYPAQLKELPDCPVIVYIRGDQAILKSPTLGVVGSRKYTNYGRDCAYRISSDCAKNGLTIASGLALGIDAFAHRAALDAGGKTVGVLGCGLDQIYPVSNFTLAKEMIEKGGAVISEFPLGTPPMKQNFPARNRIIAGLSLGTLVVEAAEKSGALITAYQSLEYNREVFAIPGNIDSPNSYGTNQLIKEGARLVTSAEDVLLELNIETKKSEDIAKDILPESPDEAKIFEILSVSEKVVDDIILESGLNVIAINTLLMMMEMKGLVRNLGGGRYKLNK